MAREGKRYTQEFKESAIQLALNSDKPAMQIAKELEMNHKTLYNWLHNYRKEHNLESFAPKRAKKTTTSESLEEENRRLRKELANLKKEREILKKAAAYFAKDEIPQERGQTM